MVPMQELGTTKDVMDALGGTAEVAKLTGRTYNAAHNWRAFPRFPSNTYVAITRALDEKGIHAPASLWGME